MTLADPVSSPPLVALRINDRTRRRWHFLALRVFRFVSVSEHGHIEHSFSCRKVLSLLAAYGDCEIHCGRCQQDRSRNPRAGRSSLFVNVTPGQEVALLVSRALLWWHGVVFHGDAGTPQEG